MMDNSEQMQNQEAQVPKEPSRAGRFFRSALRWVTGLALVFVLGVGATWFAQVRPQAEEARTLRSDLEAAQSQIDELQGEVARLEGVEAENEELQADLQQSEEHLALLSVLVDVTNARLALATNESDDALAALENTGLKLQALEDELDAEHASTLEGMQERLTLAQEEIESDRFAAQSDLEVLQNNIVSLEDSLFGE